MTSDFFVKNTLGDGKEVLPIPHPRLLPYGFTRWSARPGGAARSGFTMLVRLRSVHFQQAIVNQSFLYPLEFPLHVSYNSPPTRAIIVYVYNNTHVVIGHIRRVDIQLDAPECS